MHSDFVGAKIQHFENFEYRVFEWNRTSIRQSDPLIFQRDNLAILVPGGLKNGILTADSKTKNSNCDFRVKIPICQTFNFKV